MARTPTLVNNAVYDDLGERWFTAQDDPVALLRAEGKVTQAWVISQLHSRDMEQPKENLEMRPKPLVLDIGCGAGLAMQSLSRAGYSVIGIDISESSLRVGKAHANRLSQSQFNPPQSAHPPGLMGHFTRAHAYHLPFPDQSFDVVLCLDFLEHVENPARVIQEAARVLKPGGFFFFHTFNRTLPAYFLAAKGLEWVVRNTPKHLHVWRLFLKPSEVAAMCRTFGLEPQRWTGIKPHWFSWEFLRLLLTGRIPETFRFHMAKSMAISYLGMARKDS